MQAMTAPIQNKRDPVQSRVSFWLIDGRAYGRELLMLLYVSPSAGPNARTTATTTTATNERMIAYSISPWPFSFSANNIINPSFLKNWRALFNITQDRVN